MFNQSLFQYFAEIAQNPESNQTTQNKNLIPNQQRYQHDVWSSDSNIHSDRSGNIENLHQSSPKRLDNNSTKLPRQKTVPSHASQEQSFIMEEVRDHQNQDRDIHPDLWLAQCSEAENRNTGCPGGRPGNSRMNVVDHHIYAAVPARVRAASSDDRSVGSLVSLHSESSTTSGSNSANNHRNNPGQEYASRLQSNVVTPRKQSIDDSVNSDTRTLCDQDLPDILTDTNISSNEVPSCSLIHNQGVIPIVTTACSPPNSSSTGGGADHVVPEPVLNRIRKDCELKEEFLKRPNLPNYLSPPPPQSSQLIQDSRLGDNNCETPVLPPLASPEIDIIASPLNKALCVAAEQGELPVVTSNTPQYYSPSQNIPPNTPGFSRSHIRKDDLFAGNSEFNAQPNEVNSQEESVSRYEKLDDTREKQFTRNDPSLGKFIICKLHFSIKQIAYYL